MEEGVVRCRTKVPLGMASPLSQLEELILNIMKEREAGDYAVHRDTSDYIARRVSEYIGLLEKCDERTPISEEDVQNYGYTVAGIADTKEKGNQKVMLKRLSEAGLVKDGTFKVKEEITLKVFREYQESKKPRVTVDLSSPNNIYDSYTIRPEGKQLLDDHKKEVRDHERRLYGKGIVET